MSRFKVRSATVEDLPQLREIWQVENLPVAALEPRLAEFHVVDDGAGQLLGAVAVHVSERQGRVHHEAFTFFEQADAMRTLLWPRLETFAKNNGLTRLWTSLEAPFWKGVGFKKVTDETLASLPADFADPGAAWLAMPFRVANAGPDEIEKQFAMLKAMSDAERDRLVDRARFLKWIAMSVMVVLFGYFAYLVFRWMTLREQREKRLGTFRE